MSRNLGALTLLDPSGPAWPVMGVLYLYLFAWQHEEETRELFGILVLRKLAFIALTFIVV
jgi:hypothetical protein